MQRFKNILLVYDGKAGERSSLDRAIALARSNRAELTLLDVIEELPRDLLVLITSVYPADIRDVAVNERQRELEEIIQSVKDEGIKVSAKVLYGRPFIEIIKEVLRNSHDLVIKNVEGRDGKNEILFGSTTMHLMRKCPCPVWVLKLAPRLRFGHILAAVNPLPMEEEKNVLNRKIMELATYLAEMEKSELHIVHAWSIYYEHILKNRVNMPGLEVERIAMQAENTHKSWVEELLKSYAFKISPNHVHVLRGDAGKVILDVARQEQIDLIVMGTVGRSGGSGLFIGNTAEKVLQKVNCSVMAVKPDGFVSPVKLDLT